MDTDQQAQAQAQPQIASKPGLAQTIASGIDSAAQGLIGKAPEALQSGLSSLVSGITSQIGNIGKSQGSDSIGATPGGSEQTGYIDPRMPVKGGKRWRDRHPKTWKFFDKAWTGIKKVFGMAKPLISGALGMIPGAGGMISGGFNALTQAGGVNKGALIDIGKQAANKVAGYIPGKAGELARQGLQKLG